MGIVLEVKNLSKRFGGIQAINKVSLTFQQQELRCIIGPNGSGKTTLFNLISGQIKPDQGEVTLEGEDITHLKPYEISKRGVARKFQITSVFENLTVRDNLLVAAMGGQRVHSLFSRQPEKMALDRVGEVMSTIHLAGRGDEAASTLSHGEKQWLEIGMVIAYRPRLMLLDEPTAGMSPSETVETSRIIRRISQDITTVVIEHDIKFLKEIGEKVVVFSRGSILAEGTFDEIGNNPLVRDVYLGREGG